MERVSTGMKYLDRKLQGGLPQGTITCLESPPGSQCNSLFYTLMQHRPWLYISTYRSERAVRQEHSRAVDADTRIEHIGIERPVKNMHKALEEVETPRHVIVDTMNPLEASKHETNYVRLLNGLKDYLYDNECIALLYCTDLERAPALREVTLSMADVVWQLEIVSNDTSIEHHLIVPKYRCTEPVEEIIKLNLGQTVGFDTSRNIG